MSTNDDDGDGRRRINGGSGEYEGTRGSGGKRRRRVSSARKFAAVAACFAASGLMHEIILWLLGARNPEEPPTGEWAAFFVLQTPLVMLRWPKTLFGTKIPAIPAPLAVAVTLGTEFVLAHNLFFPPLARTELDQRVMRDVTHYLMLD